MTIASCDGGAADALGPAFRHIPDKTIAWQDLHGLTVDEDSGVRWRAAGALGAAFSHVPDKTIAWQDLVRLTGDEDRYVPMYAYHSLGRASIFKATETADKDTMKKELEAAIAFFEKSSQESANSPARFCCPFYRSYFAITFQGAKEDEVQRYLAEAKEAVGGSESKDELLGAVENLAQALHESQKLKGRSLEEIASELNSYRWYCEKAASHMATAEKSAPGAVKLMRKCTPIIEENIQTTIAQIQKKARKICEITRHSGTVYEAPVTEINRAARTISLDDICRTERSLSRITSQLKEICGLLPKGMRERVCGALEEVEMARELPDKLDKVELAIAYVGPAVETALQFGDLSQDIKKIDNKVDQVLTKVIVVDGKLDEIRFHIFKMRISSGNEISNLISIREELEKIRQLSELHPESSLRELFSCQEAQLDELSKDLEDRFAELKEILKEKASKNDIKKMEQIKPAETWRSKIWFKADKGATLLTYITFITESIAILSTVI